MLQFLLTTLVLLSQIHAYSLNDFLAGGSPVSKGLRLSFNRRSSQPLQKRDVDYVLAQSGSEYTITGFVDDNAAPILFEINTADPNTWVSSSVSDDFSSLWTCSGTDFTVSDTLGNTASGILCPSTLSLSDDVRLENISVGLATSNPFSVDGMIGLGKGSDGGNAFIDELYEKGYIDQKIASIYLHHIQMSGELNLGSTNSTLYEGTLTYVDSVSGSQSGGWYVNLDGISGGSGTAIPSSSGVALLDSSSTLTYLPSSVISDIAKTMNGTYDSSYGLYEVDCHDISISTEKLDFSFDNDVDISVPADNLYLKYDDKCYLSFYPSQNDNIVLGQSFFVGAYVVLDYENSKVGFAQVDTDGSQVTKCSVCSNVRYTCVSCSDVTYVTSTVITSTSTWYSSSTITYTDSSSTSSLSTSNYSSSSTSSSSSTVSTTLKTTSSFSSSSPISSSSPYPSPSSPSSTVSTTLTKTSSPSSSSSLSTSNNSSSSTSSSSSTVSTTLKTTSSFSSSSSSPYPSPSSPSSSSSFSFSPSASTSSSLFSLSVVTSTSSILTSSATSSSLTKSILKCSSTDSTGSCITPSSTSSSDILSSTLSSCFMTDSFGECVKSTTCTVSSTSSSITMTSFPPVVATSSTSPSQAVATSSTSSTCSVIGSTSDCSGSLRIKTTTPISKKTTEVVSFPITSTSTSLNSTASVPAPLDSTATISSETTVSSLALSSSPLTATTSGVPLFTTCDYTDSNGNVHSGAHVCSVAATEFTPNTTFTLTTVVISTDECFDFQGDKTPCSVEHSTIYIASSSYNSTPTTPEVSSIQTTTKSFSQSNTTTLSLEASSSQTSRANTVPEVSTYSAGANTCFVATYTFKGIFYFIVANLFAL